MTPNDMAELRKMLAETSVGPWEQGDGDNDIRVYCDDALGTCVAECDALMNSLPRAQRVKNMAFIAAAHEAVPALLDEIEKLRAALEPFALIAERDIGETEADQDFFSPMKDHNAAPRLRVGHFRMALSSLTPEASS